MCENAHFTATVLVHVGSSLLNCVLGVLISFSAKDKPKPKKVVDLFDEDDDDGDIFNEKFSAPPPAQSKKEVVEEQGKPPDKKVM